MIDSPLLLRPGRVAYAPERRPGEVGETPAGARVRYVDAGEFYLTKLWHAFNAVQVFMEMAFALSPETDDALQVEDRVADAYWTRHRGVLLPPRLVRQIAVLGPQPEGARLIAWIEQWMDAVGRATSFDAALHAHAGARSTVMLSTTAPVGPVVVATAEIVADLLLVQRAIASDVETAERERPPGQMRGSLLTEMDRDERLLFERALDHVLSPERLFDSLSSDAKKAARAYAPRRGDLDLRGVLAVPGL